MSLLILSDNQSIDLPYDIMDTTYSHGHYFGMCENQEIALRSSESYLYEFVVKEYLVKFGDKYYQVTGGTTMRLASMNYIQSDSDCLLFECDSCIEFPGNCEIQVITPMSTQFDIEESKHMYIIKPHNVVSMTLHANQDNFDIQAHNFYTVSNIISSQNQGARMGMMVNGKIDKVSVTKVDIIHYLVVNELSYNLFDSFDISFTKTIETLDINIAGMNASELVEILSQ